MVLDVRGNNSFSVNTHAL